MIQATSGDFLEAPAECLPLDDDACDVVLTRSVLQHLSPDLADRARREFLRVARTRIVHLENETTDGGRAYSFVHDNRAAYEALRAEIGGIRALSAEPGPVRRNSTLTIVELA